MDASSITPEAAIEDKDLKTLLDTFGSAFSLQDIASAFCKAGRDLVLTGHILSGTQTSLLSQEMHACNVSSTSRARSQAFKDNGFCETPHANGSSLKGATSKRNPVSMGTVSSVLGKNYVWRVAKSNGNPLDSKPLNVDASEFSIPASSIDHSLSKDAFLRNSEESSLRKDTDMNNDIENFLFEMLGRGFQLERSAIHEVLGQCGYDMKKGLETLLDLTAAKLDKRYDVQKDSSRHFNQARKLHVADSNNFGNNGVHLRQPNGRYEQQKEVLTSLFHAPERPDSTASASVVKSSRSFRATERVVAEPLEDVSPEYKAICTRPRLANVKDIPDDGPYHLLRKAVKEHRDTMKEYYRAATEAFASGDRARASVLQEKGQYFYNKAREADEESASKIFETCGGNDEVLDDMSLDLQDHQPKESIQLLKLHLRTFSGISFKNLKVMVGNDGRDAERRKRLVIKLLEREAIKWTEDKTSATIVIPLDEIKPESLNFARK